MFTREELGQLLIIGIEGLSLCDWERKQIQTVQPGGFILFSRNIESAEQVRQLTDELRSLCHTPPLIAIDNEGGRVWRTSSLGPTPPSAREFREHGDWAQICDFGKATGAHLEQLGINLNFGPVLDIAYDESLSNSLPQRCWGKESQQVIDFGGLFTRWMRKHQVLSCGKHFPTCGRASVDPHHDLPVIDVSIPKMLRSDLLPYTALGPELDFIMIAHAHYPQIDEDDLPATFSKNIVTQLLRQQLGYRGLIVTDDLDMGAITKKYQRGEDARMAINAGCDLVMICHQLDTIEQTIESLQTADSFSVEESLKRIAKVKRKKLKKPYPFDPNKWQATLDQLATFRENTPELCQETESSPVDEY